MNTKISKNNKVTKGVKIKPAVKVEVGHNHIRKINKIHFRVSINKKELYR